MGTREVIYKIFQELVVTSVVFVLGCGGGKMVKPDSILDNPEHHSLRGAELFEDGRLSEARWEFERARELDPKFAPAFAGLGLVEGTEGEFDEAFSLMKKGKKLAKTNEHKMISHVGMIRLYTLWQGKKWLKKAEGEFKDARKIASEEPAPYLYMGRAYRIAGDIENASTMFRKVVELGKTLVKEADEEWKTIQHIERAQPGTAVIKQIALMDEIDRADLAALLAEELKLGKIYRDKGIRPRIMKYVTPTDYQHHKLKHDIEKVLTLEVRGLEDAPEGVFEPDKKISRGDFSLVVEDILFRVNREDDLPSRFISGPSPFRDVDSDYYAYNAILVCTSRGIMSANLDGEFRKGDPVSGAEALLILRRLKEKLKY